MPLIKCKPGSAHPVFGRGGCSPGWGDTCGCGEEGRSRRFAAHQCMAARRHLHVTAQGSELCCTCSKPAPAFLKLCLSCPYVGYSPRSCIQMPSPCSISLQPDGTNASRLRKHQTQDPGVQDTGCGDGARGHSSCSCRGASRGFVIGLKSSPVATCNPSRPRPVRGGENRLGGMRYGFGARSLCLAKVTLIKPLAACKSYSYRAGN